jgi:pSer/pThr/pTyr-binding forkhead associated (FHA) protein
VRELIGDRGASAAADLRQTVLLEREELPYLVARDGADRQRLWVLEDDDQRLWIGRGDACDIVLDWDDQVSRAHAELVRVAGVWAVLDDGLSSNGTWVGGERVDGRRRLHNDDLLRIGRTSFVFRSPDGGGAGTNLASASGSGPAPDLTPAQRRVLVALCRPLAAGSEPRVPATNRAIAEELTLSVEAVKTHVRALCVKFAVGDLPQNQKRARLAERARDAGIW